MQLTMERLVEQLKEFRPQWNGKETNLISISSVCFLQRKQSLTITKFFMLDVLPTFCRASHLRL